MRLFKAHQSKNSLLDVIAAINLSGTPETINIAD